MKLLYLHGGPGLNSFAEEQVFSSIFLPHFESIEFWNEPSRLRSRKDQKVSYGFSQWMQSAHEAFVKLRSKDSSVYIIAHSFGVHAAIDLARKYSSSISGMTLISPSAASIETQRNILRISHHHFVKSRPEFAQKLEECLAQSQESMDSWILRGLELAFQDPLLFSAYWSHPEKMKSWIKVLSSPQSQFDSESFWAVSRSLSLEHLNVSYPLSIPVQVIFGENDPLTHFSKEKEIILKLFSQTQEVFIGQTAHFPHLEAPEFFIDLILSQGGF